MRKGRKQSGWVPEKQVCSSWTELMVQAMVVTVVSVVLEVAATKATMMSCRKRLQQLALQQMRPVRVIHQWLEPMGKPEEVEASTSNAARKAPMS